MTQTGDREQARNTYAYNLDPAATPRGMKVRWRVRIATGAEAERLDIIQQDVIISLLTWADKHKKATNKAPEIHSNNSPEPMEIHAE